MIVRDVDKFIGPCLATVVPYVDEVIIVDTGSRDKTKEAIARVAPDAKVFDYTEDQFPQSFLLDAQESFDIELPGPWTGRMFLSDFAAARQYSLDRCTSNYVIWLDSDDVLEDGKNLRFLVEEMERERAETAMLTYKYGWHRGRNTGVMRRDRIWKQNPWTKWHCPVHEVLAPSVGRKDYDICSVSQVFGNHPSKANVKVNLRNLKILRHWLSNKKDILTNADSRLFFYLADEEKHLWPEEALLHFKQCWSLSKWDAEKGKAHLGAGQIHEAKSAGIIKAGGNVNNAQTMMAIANYTHAMAAASFDPDAFFAAARLAHTMSIYRQCIDWTETAVAIGRRHDPRDILPYDVTTRGWKAMVPYAKSLLALGEFKKALEVTLVGLGENSADPELAEVKLTCEKNMGFALV